MSAFTDDRDERAIRELREQLSAAQERIAGLERENQELRAQTVWALDKNASTVNERDSARAALKAAGERITELERWFEAIKLQRDNMIAAREVDDRYAKVERDQLRAELERVKPVFEAAKAWRDTILGPCDSFGAKLHSAAIRELVSAIDAAIATEPK